MAVVNTNTFYEYGTNKLGFFNGSRITGTTQAPHPQDFKINTTGGTDTIIELSAIVIGGTNGLNN